MASRCHNKTEMGANATLSRIGNGGSTLYALQQLKDIYGEALGKLRVLLIHAGTQSFLVAK